MTIPAPYDRYQGEILPEWIDLNGHMNLAYYTVLFDCATDLLFDAIGIGREYRRATNHALSSPRPTIFLNAKFWSARESASPARSSEAIASACIWRMRCSA